MLEGIGWRVKGYRFRDGCWILDAGCSMLDTGFLMPDAGCWMRILDVKPDLRLLVAGHLLLVTCYWSLVTCHWSLVTCHLSLVTGYWLLITGHWSLYPVFQLSGLPVSRLPGLLAFWLLSFLILVFLTFSSMRHKIF
jgi:hypothetical protein